MGSIIDRRIVDTNVRQGVMERDRTAGTVRQQLELAFEKLTDIPDDAEAADPGQLHNVADAYHALRDLDRLLPSVMGWCCLSVNRAATGEGIRLSEREWISVFSAHRRAADARKWLDWWKADKELGHRRWELRYMPARVNVFVKQGGPPE